MFKKAFLSFWECSTVVPYIYILLHDWEGNTGEYSVRGWQYCPLRRSAVIVWLTSFSELVHCCQATIKDADYLINSHRRQLASTVITLFKKSIKNHQNIGGYLKLSTYLAKESK